MSNISIWPINRTLSGATTTGYSGPGSNGNQEVLPIPQISQDGTAPSHSLMSYPGHTHVVCVGGSYSSTEMQLVYSTAPVDWDI